MIILLVVTALLVFLRAFQSQNVVCGYYWWAVLTSYGMAIGEVAVVLIVVEAGWPSIPWVGTGGAIGVITAMYIHRKHLQCKN
jgi:hypothetical protein